MTKRLSIEEVKARFESKGYLLLEKSYKNNSTPMRFKCPNHPDLETKITINRLIKGQGCRYCGFSEMGSRRVLSQDTVVNVFVAKGYTLLDKYTSSKQKLRYICSNHPDRISQIRYSDVQQGYGCMWCGRERIVKANLGVNSHFWKGGVTELGNYLRQHLSEWKIHWLKTYDYRCAITGINSKDIEIHHVKPFHIVREETLADLGLCVRERINDYTPDELDQLRTLFIEKHGDIEGIPLIRDIHVEFHKSFGDAPSREDFFLFRRRYVMGKEEELYGETV